MRINDKRASANTHVNGHELEEHSTVTRNEDAGQDETVKRVAPDPATTVVSEMFVRITGDGSVEVSLPDNHKEALWLMFLAEETMRGNFVNQLKAARDAHQLVKATDMNAAKKANAAKRFFERFRSRH